jgi:uncharacterized iron-regulated protein
MNIRQIAALVWGLIVIVASNSIIFTPMAIALPAKIQSTEAQRTEIQRNIRFTPPQQGIIKQLQAAKIVYLGETHDQQSDHQQQLAIIQVLFKANPKLAIGMEMFQRQMQPLLDRYVAGQITAAELRAQTDFDQSWGYPWDYYAPILEFAKTNHFPLVALNTPSAISRKAARQGWASLTPEELKYIPPLTAIDRTNTKYQQMILASYQQHAGIVSIASKSFDRFYTAQLLWDETMAESTANFVRQHPDHQMIVLAGRSHIIYGYGIPDRVLRRLNQPRSIQKTVLLSLDQELQQPAIADFIWNEDQIVK